MNPPNKPSRQIEQPTHSGPPPQQQPAGPPPREVKQFQPIMEMEVSSPTLRRVSMDHLQDQLPIGPDDYVLNSVYNHQLDAWEVLVIVQPREDEEADTEAEDDE